MDFEAQRLHALAGYAILDTPAEASFDRITSLLVHLYQTPVAFVSFIDHERQWYKSSVGIDNHEIDRKNALCQYTAEAEDILLIADTQADSRFANCPFVATAPHLRFFASVPLRVSDGFVIGSVGIADTSPRDVTKADLWALIDLAATTLDQLELRRLNETGCQAESALRELNHSLELIVRQRTMAFRASQSEILQRLIRIAEYRDDDTGAHISRMSHYCTAIADGLGHSAADRDLLLHASAMHDIGKIGVPDRILLKPERLEPYELEVMKAHTLIGASMLCGGTTPLIQLAEAIAMSHHEWWDGTGYPQGLKGEQIPLVARIAAIADVFDALTSERPYKKSWSIEKATDEIIRLSGKQFEPRLVDVFLDVMPQILDIRDRLASSDELMAA